MEYYGVICGGEPSTSLTKNEMEELPPPFYDCESEYEMKQQELDEMMGRIDERTRHTWESVGRIEKHLEKLNNSVGKNTVSCGENQTSNRNLWRVIVILAIVFSAASGLGIAF